MYGDVHRSMADSSDKSWRRMFGSYWRRVHCSIGANVSTTRRNGAARRPRDSRGTFTATISSVLKRRYSWIAAFGEGPRSTPSTSSRSSSLITRTVGMCCGGTSGGCAAIHAFGAAAATACGAGVPSRLSPTSSTSPKLLAAPSRVADQGWCAGVAGARRAGTRRCGPQRGSSVGAAARGARHGDRPRSLGGDTAAGRRPTARAARTRGAGRHAQSAAPPLSGLSIA